MRLILTFLLAVSYPLAAGDSRQPVPDQAKQAESENLIKDLFKADYAKPAAADKLALAQKLLQQATETKDDPAARFVLLREARDLAALAGDTETAFSSVDQMAKDFAVDGGAEKLTVLPKLESSARTPEQAGKLAEALLQAADGAIDADDYGMAGKLMMRAEAVAVRARSMPLVTQARAQKKEFQELVRQAKAIEGAQRTLLEKPDDPEANLVVGTFTCFVKADWANGLPLLAKGTDPALKALAEKDLTTPSQPGEQLALADEWYAQAAKATAAQRPYLLARAGKWYQDALPGLSGLSKTRAEQRLVAPPKPAVTVAGTYRGEHPHWHRTIILTPDGFLGNFGTGEQHSAKWTFDGKTLTINWFNYAPETLEYDGAGGFRNDALRFSLTKVVSQNAGVPGQ
jgi:hypothetical protein